MKIDSVADAIIDEARTEASNVIKKAKAQSSEKIKLEKMELEQSKKTVLEEYEKEIKKHCEERIAAARLNAKKNIQSARDSVALLVKDALLEKMYALEKDGYKKFLATYYAKATKELGETKLVVECGPKAAGLLKTVIRHGDSIKEYSGMDEGLIVRSSNSGVMIDMTFQTIVRDRESDIRAYVYKERFK
jgi:vacuolar-type H+-ATPase subunit E/Vma4